MIAKHLNKGHVYNPNSIEYHLQKEEQQKIE